MNDLTFIRFTSGAQLHLSDGSVWRVGLKFTQIPLGWSSGDPITVGRKSGLGHDHLVTHTASGETVPVVRSRDLSAGSGFDL